MKVQILKLDELTKNNRIYSTAVIEKSLENIVEPVYGGTGCNAINMVTGEMNLQEISHKVENLRIEDGYLVGDVTILSTPAGVILKDLLNIVEFRPAGISVVSMNESRNILIDEYKIISICALDKDTAA
jgi:hypothetical protein